MSNPAIQVAAAATPTRVSGRDESLDRVKGVLVLMMVIAHTANLTLPSATWRYFIYPVALGFASGSWIFISGFLVGTHYQVGFDRDVGGTTRRLMGRGLRILAIFLVVNIALSKINFSCRSGITGGDCQAWNLLVLGQNQGMTFEILQGIGYVLIVAPLYMAMPRVATVGITLLIVFATALHFFGLRADGLTWMVLVGLAGLVLGWYVPAQSMRRVSADPDARALALFSGVLLWSLYQTATFVPDKHQMIVGVYLLGVIGGTLALYALNGWIRWRGLARRSMDRMAQYALPAYIGQMGILWIWHLLTRDNALLHSYPVSLLVVFTLLLLALAALDWGRRHVPPVATLYRVVFG